MLLYLADLRAAPDQSISDAGKLELPTIMYRVIFSPEFGLGLLR
jgi:hypothetical protein